MIEVTLCDGFPYFASVFSKSIAEATFSFPYVSDFADFCCIFIYSEEENYFKLYGENAPPFGSKAPNMTTSLIVKFFDKAINLIDGSYGNCLKSGVLDHLN